MKRGRRTKTVVTQKSLTTHWPHYEIHHNTFDNKPAMDAIIAIANALAALAERLPKGPQLQIGWPPEAP